MSDDHDAAGGREGDAVADGEYLGVLDRFEDDLGVVLLEADGETVGDVTVAREALPEDARRPDAVLRVTLRDGAPVAVRYDAEETDRRAERTQSRFDRLSRRLGDASEETTPDPDGEEDTHPSDRSVDAPSDEHDDRDAR
ncbi:DUF3006 domain-containing protein [Halomarina rubra]|uniref:DUF3006 domain-containing protein n=1 Tax=Halomarina rubra TaxID=2071873 RepID=A0ABD6B030_9EURY|nr:DUF3006 domain-containing protein [Halomarina rubra]